MNLVMGKTYYLTDDDVTIPIRVWYSDGIFVGLEEVDENGETSDEV